MSENVIDLNQRRQEKWVRMLELAQELGTVAIFGVLEDNEATIIPFRVRGETHEVSQEADRH